MDLSSESMLRTVLVSYPAAREVLTFYGRTVDEALLETTLGDLAEELEIEVEDLIAEILASED